MVDCWNVLVVLTYGRINHNQQDILLCRVDSTVTNNRPQLFNVFVLYSLLCIVCVQFIVSAGVWLLIAISVKPYTCRSRTARGGD